MNVHVLENDALRVTITDAGAELVSVIDKTTGRERIWTADPSIWNRHAPLLFPFVGKVVNGLYRINGKEYHMKTQHGFARDHEFICFEEDAGNVRHFLEATEATKAIYPYTFKLTVHHYLEPGASRALRISWIVENKGTGRMHYSIGGHPGFLIPEEIRKEDCFLVFPGKDELRYFSADKAGFAHPEKTKTLRLEDGYARYQEDIPETWIFEDQDIRRVEIAAPDRKPYITMLCDTFPMLAVWANPGGSFICLEPWFGRTDDAGFSGTLEEKRGIEILEAGERKEISYEILFH